jgi:hypothetical protein
MEEVLRVVALEVPDGISRNLAARAALPDANLSSDLTGGGAALAHRLSSDASPGRRSCAIKAGSSGLGQRED